MLVDILVMQGINRESEFMVWLQNFIIRLRGLDCKVVKGSNLYCYRVFFVIIFGLAFSI